MKQIQHNRCTHVKQNTIQYTLHKHSRSLPKLEHRPVHSDQCGALRSARLSLINIQLLIGWDLFPALFDDRSEWSGPLQVQNLSSLKMQVAHRLQTDLANSSTSSHTTKDSPGKSHTSRNSRRYAQQNKRVTYDRGFRAATHRTTSANQNVKNYILFGKRKKEKEKKEEAATMFSLQAKAFISNRAKDCSSVVVLNQ